MSDEATVRIALRVRPGAKKNAVLGRREDTWKITLQAPPIDGRANRACVEYLAKLLGLKRSAVSIVKGEKSRDKVIEISGLAQDDVQAKLQAAGENP